MTNTTIVIRNDSDVKEIVRQINEIRKVNKGKWYVIALEDSTSGVRTILKGYGTWVQTSTKTYFRTAANLTVKDFIYHLTSSVSTLIQSL